MKAKEVFRILIIVLLSQALFGCDKSKVKTVKVWQTESDVDAKRVLNEIIKDFEKQNPNIKVEHEAVSWGALSEKLTTALATGDPPDLIHLQPFMVYSLHEKGLLEPLDDVVNGLPKGDIYNSVIDLQMFDGKRYGIAYAIGTTYFSYRKDWSDEAGLSIPKTWDDYLQFIAALHKDIDGDGVIDRYGVTLPGGSPFFMDQLFAELVASNGGRMFDEAGRPTFTETPVLETLTFLKRLSEFAPPDWTSESYTDQFRSFALGKVASVPVTYARASKQIEADAANGENDPAHFAVMEQPIGPSGSLSYSTIDCEPWSIFNTSDHIQEAKLFLSFFYQPANYARFCKQVPIHLTPILRSVAEGSEYANTDFSRKWDSWQKMSLKMIEQERVKPILIAENDDRKLPFLMELQGSRIITDMILEVAVEGKGVDAAAISGQEKAEQLIDDIGYRNW